MRRLVAVRAAFRECLLLSMLIFGVVPARAAEAILDLDEPATLPPGEDHRILVLNDGIARIHIKPSKGEAASTIDLDLEGFTAEGHPTTIVGFNVENPVSVPQMAARQSIPVTAQGAEVALNAAALEPGVAYSGYLSATVGKQLIRWHIILTRALVVPPFACPDVPVTLGADGDASVTLKQVIPLAQAVVGIRLSLFTSKEHEMGTVGLPKLEGANVSTTGGQITLPLHTEGLTEGGIYAGTVSFLADKTDLGACPLTLQVPKLARAELDTDAKSLTLAISQSSPFHGAKGGFVSLRLFEKTGLRHVEGITARLDGPTDSPDGSFDVAHQVSFYIDDVLAPTLLSGGAGSSAARNIGRGEQMPITMVFNGLPHGKYTFALQFDGSNTVNPGPKVNVTVTVRDSWGWAMLTILLSVSISYFVSSGVRNWRARKALQDRIDVLGAQNFEPYGALPSVVFKKSIIAQSRALLAEGAWIWPPPESVDGMLDRVARVNSIMTRYTSLQEQLSQAEVVDSIKYHYRQEINAVMNRITAEALDQPLTDSILEDLGKISAFMSPTPETWYWAKLLGKINVEVAQTRDSWLYLDGAVSEVVWHLLDVLHKPPEKYDPDVAPRIDAAFWMLNLLVHRPDDVDDLSSAYRDAHYDFQETCKVADQMMWERIEKKKAQGRIRIVAVNAAIPEQRLKPFKLELHFDDAEIASSYLVTNVLTYEWKFDLDGNFGAPKEERIVFVDAPRVTEFETDLGQLTVSVDLICPPFKSGGSAVEGQKAHRTSGPLRLEIPKTRSFGIDDNDELAWSRLINRRESLIAGFVVLLTAITALPSLYFGKLDFGSWSDYIAILIWAIGVDQSKNLIQLVSPMDKSGSK